MKLVGAPKLVIWADKIKKNRLKVWQETSPEIFKAIEPIVTRERSAEWWIAHKDKGLEVVCKLLLGGNLQRPAAGQRKRVDQPLKKTETKKDGKGGSSET